MAVLFYINEIFGERMAVITVSLHDQTSVHCIICFNNLPLAKATAGSLYADGRQAFACNRHLYSRGLWIVAWALFDAQQLQPSQHALVGVAA